MAARKAPARKKAPSFYRKLTARHKSFLAAVENLGKAVRDEGPLDEMTAHLIQIGAAAAIRSEGAIHSHTRRALQAGVRPEQIRHAIILVTSTIGFPNVVAALSWAEDVLARKST